MAQSKPIQMKFPYGHAYLSTLSFLPPNTILLSGWVDNENTPPGLGGEAIMNYLSGNIIDVVLDFLKQFPVRKVNFTHDPEETYGSASFQQISPDTFDVTLNLDYIENQKELKDTLEDLIHPPEEGEIPMILSEFEKGKRFVCTF